MLNLSELHKELLGVMETFAQAEPERFYGRFGNDPAYRRARNCTPRTDLMLGTTEQAREEKGVVPRALRSFLGDGPSFSYERYSDVVAFEGN